MDGNIATSTLPNSFAEVKGFNTCTEKTTLGANPDSLIESMVSYCDHYKRYGKQNNTGGKRNAEVSYSKRFKVQHFQHLQTETIFKQEVCSV